ncbi:MAG TPA: RNA polymerase sigma factor [Nannocystaceae bacterium]|nr:RNA polymerase sigma factor [Nannocystaceae bacterium]
MTTSSASTSTQSSALEDEIRRHAEAERWADAATVAILGYGSELLGFVRATTSTPHDADDLFSELCERLWQRLPQFAWRSSFRTWAYAVARNLARDRMAQRAVRRRHQVPLSDAPHAALVAAVRSTIERTPASADPRLELLRTILDEDERAILVLRVELAMPWTEIATVLGAEGDAATTRAAARLRKQFERIKERARRGLAR